MIRKKNINLILKEVLREINPSVEEIGYIDSELKIFLKDLRLRIKKLKINVELFIGGSFARKTLIKKDIYDVDIFLRFDKKYGNRELSSLTEKILKGIKKRKIHGSRDYFEIEINKSLFFEIVPVKKISNIKQAENVTDLSYSHVSYIKKKIRNESILDEIKIAKAFLQANRLYGAESHIGGFSGYSLELLICYYKSFFNFIKNISKIKDKKIIDIEKQYKNKKNVLTDINASKLISPIVLVDPTCKNRNVLAALKKSSLDKFQNICKDFLKNPSIKFFNYTKINYEEIRKISKENKLEFIKAELKTKKQKGSIAGSKLLKFYNHLGKEISKPFEIKKNDFEYLGENSGKGYFVAKPKKEILIQGPKISQKENVKKFKNAHKKTIIKRGRIFAREKTETNLKKFLEKWLKQNRKQIKDMSVSSVGLT